MTLQYQSSDPAQKPALRRLFKQQRQGLSVQLRDEHHQNIMQHLNRLLAEQVDAHHFAIYLATHDEADLQPWIESAWNDAKRLYAPVVGKTEGQMAFYPLTEATPLRQGRFKLREPAVEDNALAIAPQHIDVALVPLLAFNLYGQRLGMGGGFYDRYFAKSARRPKIIGIGYEVQLAEHRLPTEPWDIALDAVVTENGARAFGAQLA